MKTHVRGCVPTRTPHRVRASDACMRKHVRAIFICGYAMAIDMIYNEMGEKMYNIYCTQDDSRWMAVVRVLHFFSFFFFLLQAQLRHTHVPFKFIDGSLHRAHGKRASERSERDKDGREGEQKE